MKVHFKIESGNGFAFYGSMEHHRVKALVDFALQCILDDVKMESIQVATPEVQPPETAKGAS